MFSCRTRLAVYIHVLYTDGAKNQCIVRSLETAPWPGYTRLMLGQGEHISVQCPRQG